MVSNCDSTARTITQLSREIWTKTNTSPRKQRLVAHLATEVPEICHWSDEEIRKMVHGGRVAFVSLRYETLRGYSKQRSHLSPPHKKLWKSRFEVISSGIQ